MKTKKNEGKGGLVLTDREKFDLITKGKKPVAKKTTPTTKKKKK
jgi:hypothetical protein